MLRFEKNDKIQTQLEPKVCMHPLADITSAKGSPRKYETPAERFS